MKTRRQSNESLDSKIVLLALKSVQGILHSANGSTLLNSQGIQFNLGNLTSSGDSILTPNNSHTVNTTQFIANFKCKVEIAAAMHIDDNGNSASAGVYISKNGSTVMVGTRTTDEVRGQCATSLILEAGDRFAINLPIGIAVAGQPVFLNVTAERIYSQSELEALV